VPLGYAMIELWETQERGAGQENGNRSAGKMVPIKTRGCIIGGKMGGWKGNLSRRGLQKKAGGAGFQHVEVETT